MAPAGGQVRPAAEIDELALPVERHAGLFGQPLAEVFHLERLAQVLEELDGLVPRHVYPLEGLVFGDDPRHLGLDLRKILGRKRVLHLEVVIEAVVYGRAEGQLHALEEPHHRAGHHVGGGMPQDAQGLGVLTGQQPQANLALGGQRHVGPRELPVHLGRQRGLSQPRADLRGHVDGPHGMRELQNLSVRQNNFEHSPPV